MNISFHKRGKNHHPITFSILSALDDALYLVCSVLVRRIHTISLKGFFCYLISLSNGHSVREIKISNSVGFFSRQNK